MLKRLLNCQVILFMDAIKRFIKKIRPTKFTLVISLLIAVLGIFIIGHISQASSSFDFLIEMFTALIYYIIIWPLGLLLELLIWLMIQFAQFNEFINAQAVALGWTVVRDLVNSFFILILLVIAFATILQIESYQYKKALPRLLIAAVLVNFSRTICGIFIDFGQVVMNTFVAGFRDIAMGNLTQALGLDGILDLDDNVEGVESSDVLGAVVIGAVMVIVATAVVLVTILTLVMRIVMLWILVVLSPLAYLLSSVTFGQRFATQWWHMFAKYVVVGPVLAFFLWLSFYIMGTGDIDPNQLKSGGGPGGTQLSQVETEEAEAFGAGISKATQEGQMMSYIVCIGLLAGALVITQQLGVASGKFAGAALGKLQAMGMSAITGPFRAAGKAAKFVGGYARERAEEVTGVALSPTEWKEAWQRSREKSRNIRKQGRLAKAAKRTGAVGALGTPTHFFDQYVGGMGIMKWGKLWREGLRGRRAGDQVELAEKLRGNADDIKKRRDSIKDPVLQYKDNLISNAQAKESEADKIQEKMEEKAKKYDEKIEKSTKPEEAENWRKRKEKELEEMSEKKSGLIQEADDLRTQADMPLEDLDKMLREEEKGTIAKYESEAERLDTLANQGKLSDEQKNTRNTILESINRRQQKALDEIREELASLSAIPESERTNAQNERLAELRESERNNFAEVRAPFEAEKNRLRNKYGTDDNASEEMIEENREAAKELQQAADKLKAREPYSDEKYNQLDEEWKEANKRATAQERYAAIARPAVNYELRRAQRMGVDEEKKEMTTDSWEELVSIFEEAKERNDLNRAGAAFLRLAETTNENEIQNYFGYDSGGPGMRQFILNQLVGKRGLAKMSKEDKRRYEDEITEDGMGMSLEQAMTIGTDASYIAEGKGHWGAARLVGTKNGRQVFKPESERQMEIMAEMRKLDFEKIMRNMNRLAIGEEVPDEDWRVTGQREFNLYPSAAALILEKIRSMPDLLKRGRISTSNVINIAKPQSLKLLRNLARRQRMDMKEFEKIAKSISKAAEIAGTGEDQFNIIKNAQESAAELKGKGAV